MCHEIFLSSVALVVVPGKFMLACLALHLCHRMPLRAELWGGWPARAEAESEQRPWPGSQSSWGSRCTAERLSSPVLPTVGSVSKTPAAQGRGGGTHISVRAVLALSLSLSLTHRTVHSMAAASGSLSVPSSEGDGKHLLSSPVAPHPSPGELPPQGPG